MPKPRSSAFTLPTIDRHAHADRLVARIADGDPAALAELKRSLRSQVCNTVAVHIHDPRQLGAVIAATFVEVWRLAHTAHVVPGSALDWILAIADRRATERRRADAATGPLIRDLAAVHDQSHILELHRHMREPMTSTDEPTG